MPVTKITLLELRPKLTDYLRAVHEGERILVTSHGRPWAAIVPIEDLEVLEGKASEKARRKPRGRSSRS